MIIQNPESSIVAFDLTEWLAEEESCSKKLVAKFLSKQYQKIVGDVEKANSVEEAESADSPNEQDETEEDEDEPKNQELYDLLVESQYNHFSISESGGILLLRDNDADKIFLTDGEAKELLPILTKVLESRISKLSKLVK